MAVRGVTLVDIPLSANSHYEDAMTPKSIEDLATFLPIEGDT